MEASWEKIQWRLQKGREERERARKDKWRRRQEETKEAIRALDPKQMPQVTKEGMYWFTDLNNKKWFVQIEDPRRLKSKQSTMLEVGSTVIKEVDSIGVGEFIGPIIPLSGYR